MPIFKHMKGTVTEWCAAEGFLEEDWGALTPCQMACTNRLGKTIQIEQEAYMTAHPEIKAMMEAFVAKMTLTAHRRNVLKEAGLYFTRPAEELDGEIRKRLGLPPQGPYIKADKLPFKYEDVTLINDLKNITLEYYPLPPLKVKTPEVSPPNTPSSSFVSIITSASTLPTPEPIPTPEPTLSETFFAVVSNTVDKAIYSRVDDRALRYDTAYVEVMKAVEEAMEITVVEIKEDIAELFFNAYKLFELDILEKERIAAEIAWERRMRKKLKRTLRRLNNFKGYETPPTPKSEVSSHESYKLPALKPCVCHPQFNYNRYSKDRFGIYLPSGDDYDGKNVTVTPVISEENIPGAVAAGDVKSETKSNVSKKSAGLKKTQFKQ